MNQSQKLVSEFIGTFTLIFVGVSSICVDNLLHPGNVNLVSIALAHGLSLCVMISAMGYISGGHFNPAVTLGAWVGRKINTNGLISYIIAQLFGGIVGALAVKAIFPAEAVAAVKFGTPMLAENITSGAGVLMEFIMTFFLVLVVYGTAIDSRAPKLGGLLIGLTVTLDILAGGPMTGASMNPARTFGPALIGGYWTDHLVYWIGPLLGGAAAGLTFRHVIGKEAA